MTRKLLHSQQVHGEKILYGLRLSDRQLVRIEEVPNGKDCGCICPSLDCRQPLIAANREDIKIAKHFKHAPMDGGLGSRPCAAPGGIAETITHIKAKEWIQKNLRIALPSLTITRADDTDGCTYDAHLVKGSSKVKLDRAYLEQREEGFIPDCTAYIGDKKLLIEVYFTHAVDEVKAKKIHDTNVSTLEIIFPKSLVDPSDEDLEKIIMNPIHGRWIFNAVSNTAENQRAATESFDRTRSEFEKERNKRRLENRKRARSLAVKEYAIQMRQAYKSNNEDQVSRLTEHLKTIDLEARISQIEGLLKQLEIDLYPNGITRSPIESSLHSGIRSRIDYAIQHMKVRSKELFMKDYENIYTIDYFLAIAERRTPAAEDARWKPMEDSSHHGDLF